MDEKTERSYCQPTQSASSESGSSQPNSPSSSSAPSSPRNVETLGANNNNNGLSINNNNKKPNGVNSLRQQQQQQLPTMNPAGMLDRSRVGLCVFMFAVLAFNPMGILLSTVETGGGSAPAAAAAASSDYSMPHRGGRMLSWFGSDDGSNQKSWVQSISW